VKRCVVLLLMCLMVLVAGSCAVEAAADSGKSVRLLYSNNINGQVAGKG
jgi:putative cell wall-binding protein